MSSNDGVTMALLPIVSAILLPILLIVTIMRISWPKRGRVLAAGATHAPLADTSCLKNGFATRKVPEMVDTIVVGSGMAGLTTAALLAKRGHKVLVLEQHDVAGGCTHTFEERGFEFDTGLHYVGDLLGTVLNAVTTGTIEWASTGALVDEIFFGSDRLPILSPKAAFLEEFKKRFPEEHAAIAAYRWQVLWAHVVFGIYLMLRQLPSWLGLPLLQRLGRMRTTKEALHDLTKSSRLQQALSYIWGTYGVPPSRSPWHFHLMLQNHYFNGGYYPVGGCAQLAARLIPTIERAGGKVLVRAPVTALACDGDGAATGVIVRGEHVIMAKRVVSAAGVLNTFCRLMPEALRPKIAHILQSVRDAPPISPPVDKETKVEPSVAFLYLFLGLSSSSGSSDAAAEGDLVPPLELPKHNIWCFSAWDHEVACELPTSLDDVGAQHPILMFISSPSAKDPSWSSRHPGKQVVLALAPTRMEYWQKWKDARIKKRGAEYDMLKQTLTRRMTDAVLEHLPQIRNRIEYVDLGTPLTNDFYLGSRHGEAYGLAHTPARFSMPWLVPATPVPNLYLAGQDLVTDGVVGGVLSGFMTAGSIDKRVLLMEAGTLLVAALQALAT